MEDYSEWLEATVGTDALGDVMDEDAVRQVNVQYEGRDAVLCLIDCQLSMFQTTHTRNESVHKRLTDDTASHGTTVSTTDITTLISGVKTSKGEGAASLGSVMAGTALATKKNEEEEGGTTQFVKVQNGTFFGNALRSVLTLYQNKAITSEKDIVALVLYNTRVGRNAYDLPGLYIFCPFAFLGVQFVQEVEKLAAAGDVSSMEYEEFNKNIGHTQEKVVCLSDVLWVLRHMFFSLHSSVIKYRRIFLFTNDDEPHRGNMVEMERCIARVQELHEAGVLLEVFALSEQFEVDVSQKGNDNSDLNIHFIDREKQDVKAPSQDGMWEVKKGPSMSFFAERHFSSGTFWGQLHRVAHGTKKIKRGDVDAVHVNSGIQTFDGLIDVVRRRTHPQRPFQDCLLTIGVSADGSPVPTMAVSVYYSLLPAPPPQTKWMDRRTNALISRQMQFVAKVSSSSSRKRLGDEMKKNGETNAETKQGDEGTEENTEFVVTPDNLLQYTLVGSRPLFFTLRERQHIVETATAGAPIGFSILCFKRTEDILRHEHIIRKSTFLHPNPRDGGEASLRLFVRLTQVLLRQNKVAVAQYIARCGAVPRLVALAPSPPPASVPTCSLPVEGIGLYVVPLPYAEDIRSVPSLPCFDPASVPLLQDIAKAQRIVSSLSVPYNINAVQNPSLRLRYQILQDVKLQHSADGGTADPAGIVDRAHTLVDESLPDRKGMACYAELFREFKTTVLGHSYDADRLCPQPKTNGIAVGKTFRAEDGVSFNIGDGGSGNEAAVRLVETAFEQNALQTLTVVQLKTYLSAVGESAVGARRKDEVVEFVTRVLIKRKKG